MDCPHDAVRCCGLVLKLWLDTSVDATWNQLIEVLKRIHSESFATELEQKLTGPECKTDYAGMYDT